ncbi:MAG: DNA/RNA non-specific endonuclease [Geminicoccales bacterium]
MPSQSDTQALKDYLATITREGSIEAIADDKEAVMRMTGARPVRKTEAQKAQGAVQKLARGKEISSEEALFIEAIIIPDKRPAIDIVDDDFTVTETDWVHYDSNLSIKRQILNAIPSVGRIELPDHWSAPYGGTGFVVGENLIMTNRHVAQIFASGVGLQGLQFIPGQTAGIDFKKEKGSDESRFLDVVEVAMVHPYWDMALLHMRGLGENVQPLTLSLTPPEDLIDRDIAAIGYPAFDPRNNTEVQERVFNGTYNVKRLQPGRLRRRALVQSYGKATDCLTHDASTLGGNSGSCVLDVTTGEIVALHFAGIYKKANYAVPAFELSRDEHVAAAGVEFGRDDLANVEQPNPWRDHWVAADPQQEGAKPLVQAVGTHSDQQASIGQAVTTDGGVTLTIPLMVNVRLGQPEQQVGSGAAAQVPVSSSSGSLVFEASMVHPVHDPDYAARQGYDENFLGILAPMPMASNKDDLATIDCGSEVLPYHHFSVVMNKKRRLAQITAANIDTNRQSQRPEPGRDYGRKALNGFTSEHQRERWFTDPRLPADHQLPDRFFTKDRKAFDRGHLVRRAAVVWGQTYQEVQFANGDTFHVTNCSPQVKGFNRSNLRGLWGQLENHVAAESKTEKLCVFSGPVLKADDPVFNGVDDAGSVRVKIPIAFWKVIAAANEGALNVFAFKLEQDLNDVAFEFQVTPKWQQHQLSLKDLEQELGSIRFPKSLHDADQASTSIGKAIREATGIGFSSPAKK